MPDISQFDQEFLTAGSQSAEGEKLAGLVQQNLTPEEQQRLEEIMPVIEEFNMLMYKAQTGEEPPIDEEMGLTNGQGMVEPGPRDGMVPQDIQNQQGMPPRPIEGQMPESAPDQGMQMGGVAAGPVGVVNEQSADGSGVADDVPAKSDGFVINAAAVRHAGLRDVNDMIQDAITYAKRQGMKLDFDKTPVDAEKILVSNGEVVIPDVIANIIGYDRLEKINKRGEKETEKAIQEEQQQPPAPQKPTQPVMRAAEGGQMKDLFPAESAIALEELEEVRKSKEPDRELAVRVYEALTVPETGVFKDPFIRTQVIPPRGSTAYGPVQITKDLMKNPKYSDINDPYEAIARQRLINQGEKFAKFGNRAWERLLKSREITQKEANEAAALYEYGKSGDYVRDDRDKEDYKRYAVSIINRKLKDLEKEGFKDKEKLEKFLKEWNPKASKKYIKEFFDTFEKNLDN